MYKNLLFIALFFGSAAYSAAAHLTSLNCLSKKLSPDRKQFCSHVIDPMKAKQGNLYVLDCTKELGDGYEQGICEKVDAIEQANLRSDTLRGTR